VGDVPEPLDRVTLEGRFVRLEPLSLDHVPALVRAASLDRSTYALTWVPDGIEAMTGYVEHLLAEHARCHMLPFAQRRLDTGEIVGCTRYLEIRWWRGRREPDEVEIGGTWLSAAAQRTAVNTDAKLLLLAHAFERLGVWRVALCTDAANRRSRDAILRIGATFEGILRHHRLRYNTPTPEPRDSAMYSVIEEQVAELRLPETRYAEPASIYPAL